MVIVRVDTTFNGTIYGRPFCSGDAGQGNRYRDNFNSRSRMALTVDTRTATEYGVVRTFGQGDFQFQQLRQRTTTRTMSSRSPAGVNNALLSRAGGGYVAVEMVFIQFAGFTFGKSASAYATPWNGYPGNNNSFLMGGHDTVTGVNNIQYTAQFGNGVSGTIGLDDPTVFNRTAVVQPSAGLPAAGNRRWSPTPTAARMLPTSSATSASIRPGVCSRFRRVAHLVNASYNILRRWLVLRTTCRKSAATPTTSGAVR